jgi:hypothetical protein
MRGRQQTTAKTTGRRPGRPSKNHQPPVIDVRPRTAAQIADSLEVKARELQQIARILRGDS